MMIFRKAKSLETIQEGTRGKKIKIKDFHWRCQLSLDAMKERKITNPELVIADYLVVLSLDNNDICIVVIEDGKDEYSVNISELEWNRIPLVSLRPCFSARPFVERKPDLKGSQT